MRFLQTEWHRHERDRNAWEIEKQEMKSRIASLEGQARRSDNTQRTLKKYVAILEKKVKEQAASLKAGKGADSDAEKLRVDRAALIQEKLKCKLFRSPAEAYSRANKIPQQNKNTLANPRRKATAPSYFLPTTSPAATT